MVKMPKVNNIRLEFIKRASEGRIQRRVDIPVLVVGHIYAPNFDGADGVVLFVSDCGIRYAGQLFPGEHHHVVSFL
jgi:hypothetical protein